MIRSLELRGLREGLDQALRDVLAVGADERVAAVMVAALVVTGSGARRRAAWRVQLVQAGALQETRARLMADAAHAVRQVATGEADA
jgi:hypothetical protein